MPQKVLTIKSGKSLTIQRGKKLEIPEGLGLNAFFPDPYRSNFKAFVPDLKLTSKKLYLVNYNDLKNIIISSGLVNYNPLCFQVGIVIAKHHKNKNPKTSSTKNKRNERHFITEGLKGSPTRATVC